MPNFRVNRSAVRHTHTHMEKYKILDHWCQIKILTSKSYALWNVFLNWSKTESDIRYPPPPNIKLIYYEQGRINPLILVGTVIWITLEHPVIASRTLGWPSKAPRVKWANLWLWYQTSTSLSQTDREFQFLLPPKSMLTLFQEQGIDLLIEFSSFTRYYFSLA